MARHFTLWGVDNTKKTFNKHHA
ncbi:hypothetical protein AYI68_g2691, partial [Smittium mucronatum]